MRTSSRFRCFVARATSSLDASGWPSRALANAADVFGPQMHHAQTQSRAENSETEIGGPHSSLVHLHPISLQDPMEVPSQITPPHVRHTRLHTLGRAGQPN